MSARPRALLPLAAALVAAHAAPAFVPPAEKIVGAAAEFNADVGRDVPLHLEVVLRREDPTNPDELGDAVATGELLSDPRGSARLELRGARGAQERHLLRGARLTASRDGSALSDPRAYLPPLPVLQAGELLALQDNLRALGVAVDEVELGRSQGRDCYVVGGRARSAGRNRPPARAALWVDMDSYAIVRVDRADGVSFQFGPSQTFDRVLLPAWISVRARGEPPVRLEVRNARPVEPGQADFASDWLLSP